MNKKKLLILAVIITLIATIGITTAFMFKETSVKHSFKPSEVSCEVHEMMDGLEVATAGSNAKEVTQWGNKKHSIKVENTGDVTSYIRIKVVSYWVDGKGKVIGLPSEQPSFELKSCWLNGGEGTYYYKTPVEPGMFTDILGTTMDLKVKLDAEGNKVFQAVDVFAEAMQAEPTDAVKEAWCVDIDGDGNIEK